MHKGRIAVMFAGQGKPDRDVLAPSGVTRPDAASGAELGLRIFAASVEAYTHLLHSGVAPHVLIGHGFGEIAALVAAGAFSMSEGAEIVDARCSALAEAGSTRYSMAAIQASPEQIEKLLSLLRSDAVSVAAENSSHETVIVGPWPVVEAAADLAAAVNFAVVPLKCQGAPHQPLACERRAAMTSALRHIVQRPLHTPVFSPLKGRLYRDSDLLVDCLAQQLGERIRFAGAIAKLVRDGVSLVVECGPLRGLAENLDCDSVADTEFCRAWEQEVA